jgi:hypothetical protein
VSLQTFVLDLALYVEATQGYDTLLPVHAQRAEPAVVPVVIDDSKPSAELKPPEQPLVHKVWAFVRRYAQQPTSGTLVSSIVNSRVNI